MEESEILRALRQDPETGSSMLVEQYRYLLWGVCSRRLQDPEDAWDCVYEALADFCLQWQKFRPEKRQPEELSHRHCRPQGARRVPPQPRVGAREAGGRRTRRGERAAADGRAAGRVAAGTGLAEKERSIVLLRCVHRMSYQEIAKVLGLPYEQTRKCGYRGLKKLRDKLTSP